MRRLSTALVVLGVVLALSSSSVGAQTADPTTPPVDVFEVSGFIDAPVADGIEHAISRSETDGAQALVLQMNSPGALVSRDRMEALAQRIHDAAVPVTIWVGPSGAKAKGLAGQLLGAAVVTGMAPGSRIGDFIVVLDGVSANGKTLDTANVVSKGTELRRERNGPTRFAKLGLLPRLMHTVASPPVTYLLLTIGLALLIFEFFTAGIGIAGAVGAVCVVLGCYGAVALPTRPWAFALLIMAMLAFAVDVQTGVPRFWTGVGVVSYVVASVFLYDGLSLSWVTLLAGIGGVLLAFLAGMPAMVRTRYATPTIGRDWMVGEQGEAVVAVDPDGVVRVRGAQWRARTNRATPIARGDRIRVVAIEGVTLEVEPETGGAEDYRERARRRRAPHAAADTP